MTDEIMSVGPWATNGEMIADVAKLGYLNGYVLDLTYGLGRFWNVWRPTHLTENDIDPERGVHHYDFTKTPPPDWYLAFDSVVLDPDYKTAGKRTKDAHNEAYGVVGGYKSPSQIMLTYRGGMEFAWRCLRPGGHLLVKSMSQIVSGSRFPMPFEVWTDALYRGYKLRDEFQLVHHPRPQPPGRGQKSARSNASSLLVFTKPRNAK